MEAAPPKLVVDASIESGTPPFVVLSKSLNYFGSVSPEDLSKTFERNAVITVNNGIKTHLLKEYAFTDTSGYTFYYYSIDSSDLSTAFAGDFNTTYTLNITTSDGENYAASTYIPGNDKRCDSLWWQPVESNDDTALCAIYGRFYDPPGLGNYGRYFTKRNSERYFPGSNSVFDDQVIDGKTFSLRFDLGIDRNSIETDDNKDRDFPRYGDTVTMKYCNIDKASYTFWNTWEFAFQSYGNPFSSPIKVLGNVSNGALGAFCGYAVAYRTLIIPK